MKSKDLPLRKCVACQSMKAKNYMFRLVKTSDGIFYDSTYKRDGRGAYICKNNKCLDLAIKKKSFNRALKAAVNQEVINDLYTELMDDNR